MDVGHGSAASSVPEKTSELCFKTHELLIRREFLSKYLLAIVFVNLQTKFKIFKVPILT